MKSITEVLKTHRFTKCRFKLTETKMNIKENVWDEWETYCI